MASDSNKERNRLITLMSVIATGLYIQLQHLFIYSDFSAAGVRLVLTLLISAVSAILYIFLIGKFFSFLSRNNKPAARLERNFHFCHAPLLLLYLYPFQFLTYSSFITMYLLAVSVFLFIVSLTVFFIIPFFSSLFESFCADLGTFSIVIKPLRIVLFLFMYFSVWHFAVAYIFLDMTNFEKDLVRGPLMALLAIYFSASLLLTLIIYTVSYINKRKINIIFYSILAAVASFSLFARCLDFGTFAYSGRRVDSIIWDHFLYKENFMFLFSGAGLTGMTLAAIVLYLFTYLMKDSRRYVEELVRISAGSHEVIRRLLYLSGGITLSATLLIYSGIFSLFYLTEPIYARNYDAALYINIPETHVASSLYEYLFTSDEIITVLPEDLAEKCRKAGWNLKTVSEEYPFLKKSIYLDEKSKSNDKPALKPGTNIIIIFAESFSKYFTEESMHKQKGLTPNIDDMKMHGITFENMYNIIAPTITGIIATMGSFPYYVENYNITQNNHLTNTRFCFLTSILNSHGYYSVHFQGSSSDFASAETIFKSHGYNDFISIENEELRNYAIEPKSNWGLRDSDLFRYIVHSLEENKFRRPFVMTVSTIDLHPPYKLNGGYKNFSDPIFDCVHSTDSAFGIFWEYFKKSPYYGNTAVLFIADHAMVMNTQYFKLRGEDFSRSRQDLITSILYVPGNDKWHNRKVITDCTNLDVAPTFCDMLGIDPVNSFMGLSVFSERITYPYVPGEIRLDSIFGSDNQSPLKISFSEIPLKKDRGFKGQFMLNGPFVTDGITSNDFYTLINPSTRQVSFSQNENKEIRTFVKGLAEKNRIYPPKNSVLLNK